MNVKLNKPKLTVLLIIIWVISGVFLSRLSGNLPPLTSQIDGAQLRVRALISEKERLNQILTSFDKDTQVSQGTVLPIDDAVSQFEARLKGGAINHFISLGTQSLPQLPGTSASQLASSAKSTTFGLKRLTVMTGGTYRSLSEFLSWIDEVAMQGVSLGEITLDKDTFRITWDVLGQ